jgi:O-antigen/teichoic acid export membrane protein
VAQPASIAGGPGVSVARVGLSRAFWVAIANLSQAAGPFVGLLALTKLHGLEAAGHFAYAQAVTAPLAQLMNFQLKALLLTHSDEEIPLSLAVRLRTLTSLPGLAAVLGLGFWISPLTGLWMFSRLIDSWAELYQTQSQRHGDMASCAVSVAFRALMLVLLLAWIPGLEVAAGLYCCLSLTVLCAFDFRFRTPSTARHGGSLESLFRRGLLLGLILFLQALGSSIPRIVLEKYTDTITLGLFANFAVMVQGGTLLVTSYGQSLLPTLASAPVGKVVRICSITMALAGFVFLGEQLFATTAFKLLNIEESVLARELLWAMGLTQLTVWPAALVGFALTARRLYGSLLWVGVSLALTSLIGSLLVVPRWGAAGAATALGLVGFATLAVSLLSLRQARDAR